MVFVFWDTHRIFPIDYQRAKRSTVTTTLPYWIDYLAILNRRGGEKKTALSPRQFIDSLIDEN